MSHLLSMCSFSSSTKHSSQSIHACFSPVFRIRRSLGQSHSILSMSPSPTSSSSHLPPGRWFKKAEVCWMKNYSTQVKPFHFCLKKMYSLTPIARVDKEARFTSVDSCHKWEGDAFIPFSLCSDHRQRLWSCQC